jgi:hypothetical protein
MTSILVEGKPTKSGKPTYLYYDNKGEVVSLLQDTAEKKGYKPVLNSDNITINNTNITEIVSDDHTDEHEVVLFKGPEQLFRELVFSNNSFEIYYGEEKIFDTDNTNKNKILFEKAGFHIFGKIYSYNGIYLKKK